MTNKIWKNIKNLAYSIPIAAMSFLPGCEPDYELPTASINVNPKSGDAPLSINVKGYGTPGTEDIKAYTLYVDNWKKTKSTPFDTTFVLNNVGDHKMHMEIKDTENKIDLTDPVTVTVYQGPYIEQSASLVNDNEISYSATLSKKSSAELKVKKDGLAFLTLQITDVNSSGVDFQKTFKYNPDGIRKGNYEFNLEADDLKKTNSIEVPNYKPTTDLSGVDAELMEGVEKTVALPTPLDKNPEDNPVAIRSATSLDDKTQVALNGNNLTIKPLTYTGDYQVEIEFGSTAGGLEKAILAGSITQEPWTYYVNPFVSTNPNGAAYDALTTKAQRDAYVQEKLFDDWTNTIPGIIHIWDCTQYSEQVHINLHGITNPENYVKLPQYYGDILDSLYYYGGTLKDNGKYGLPVYFVNIHWEGGLGHNMSCILTGGIENGDITKFENWNFIESSNDRINQKPGLSYMPENCTVEIKAPTRYRDEMYNNLYFPILRFEIENGIQTSYWINDDPNLKIITQRENKK